MATLESIRLTHAERQRFLQDHLSRPSSAILKQLLLQAIAWCDLCLDLASATSDESETLAQAASSKQRLLLGEHETTTRQLLRSFQDRFPQAQSDPGIAQLIEVSRLVSDILATNSETTGNFLRLQQRVFLGGLVDILATNSSPNRRATREPRHLSDADRYLQNLERFTSDCCTWCVLAEILLRRIASALAGQSVSPTVDETQLVDAYATVRDRFEVKLREVQSVT